MNATTTTGKTKLDKALFIAEVLFQKAVGPENWKVKELQKKKVTELNDLVAMAEKAYESRMLLISTNN